MKKSHKLIIVLISYMLLITPSLSNAAFNETVGNIYTYDVVKSEADIVWGANSGQGTGLNVGGNPYPVGITFTIEVLTATASSVQWEINIDGNTATNSDTGARTAEMNILQFLPYAYYGGLVSWDQAEIEMGPIILLGFFFLEPTAFDTYFQNYHDTISGLTPMPAWTFDEINANFDKSENIAEFDWVFNTMYNDTGCNMFFQGTHYLRVAYDQTTGVLMGYTLDFDYAGHVGLNALEMAISQTIEQVGFNIGKNQYKAPGYTFLIVIPVIFGMSLLMINNRKKK